MVIKIKPGAEKADIQWYAFVGGMSVDVDEVSGIAAAFPLRSPDDSMLGEGPQTHEIEDQIIAGVLEEYDRLCRGDPYHDTGGGRLREHHAAFP